MLKHYLFLAFGLMVLVVGADLLVRGARNIARSYGVPTLIIGLTIVAFGTSAPELFVSVTAALQGNADVAVGNIIGSNLFNVLIIIGLTAVISPLRIDRSILMREMPIMLIALGLFVIFSGDLRLSRLDGAILFGGIIGYLAMNFMLVRRGRLASDEAVSEDEKIKPSFRRDGALVVAGLIGLVWGAGLIVEHAIVIAKYYHISDLVIGVTLVAIGTSLPELATTVVAAARGEPALAVGNAIGSNIFNVFCVIGGTSLISPLNVNPSALHFDMVYMLGACLLAWPLMKTRNMLGRMEGALMLLAYGAFIFYIVINLSPVRS